MTDAPSAITRALERDEGLEILVDMMAVSRRFHFFILACDTPRVTRAALTFIRERIEAERGTGAERGNGLHVHWLNPYQSPGVTLDRPVAPDVLIQATLPRLLHPEDQGEPGDDILVLDASLALPQDDRAWNLLFQRMNEQRNSIVRAITGSLVLCVPPRLEVVFARAAPDFWSIRSTAVSLTVTPPSSPRIAFLQDLLRTTPVVTTEWMRELGRTGDFAAMAYDLDWSVHARINALIVLMLQGLIDGHPRYAMQHAEHFLSLTKDISDPYLVRHIESLRWLAWTACVLGEAERAAAVIAEGVALARLNAAHPYYQLHLAEILLDQAQIARWCEEHSVAEIAAEEAVRLAQDVLADQPERASVESDVAMYMVCLGDLTYETGDLARAETAYRGGLRHFRELLARLPDVGDFMLGAADGLLRLGLVSWTRRGVDAGIDPCLEAVALLRQILERSPERDDVTHTLAVHLGNLGDLHLEREDPARAGLAYVESLQICRELRATDPQNVFWGHTSATSLMRWARYCEQEQQGPLADAATAWQEAHSLLTGLLGVAPARSDWARLLAECADEMARISALLAAAPQ